ncbi:MULTISPECIES: DUF1702 family protein [Actinomycetes]|uniref:DUF1702 family protein n=1 Tax=Actinomycetes TaxID=1760 RepID=UPI00068038B6|nr:MULTISPECIES: DUF1702 family protein [Actinomycetes]
MKNGGPTPFSGKLRLPAGTADFARRGFRLDRPADRSVLENCARGFVAGFNAVAGWRDPHDALARIPDEERGFAYEGAGMRAALTDLATMGSAGALAKLLAGPGSGYVHLVHVGYGWGLVPSRLPVPVVLPRTPLLRWLALDGAGFAEVYFGGIAAAKRRSRSVGTVKGDARLAGCGRALWFVESADPDGIARAIATLPAAARPHLWAGVGLAACYAGNAGETRIDQVAKASGKAEPYLRQGALFAIAARFRSGIVPAHTTLACRRLFAAEPDEAAEWTETAADGLKERSDPEAYLEWKSRLRKLACRPA